MDLSTAPRVANSHRYLRSRRRARVVITFGVVGFFLEATGCLAAAANDYRLGFWLLLTGSVMGSWSWRIWKASHIREVVADV